MHNNVGRRLRPVLLNRPELVRCDHQRRLERLIKTTREAPNRKRLHALRLRIKTIRYQRSGWSRKLFSLSLSQETDTPTSAAGALRRAGGFSSLGKRLSRRAEANQKGLKTFCARAKAETEDPGWLRRDAIGAEDVDAVE